MICLFCGKEGKRSQEHVFPHWLEKLFPNLGEIETHRAFQVRGGPLRVHKRPGVAFDQTVGKFCQACNTGWMHELEACAEPILTPPIRDQAATLGPLDQDTIAVWATKTILAASPTNLGGDMLVPQETYRWFGEQRRPLPGNLAWIGRYAGAGQWPTSLKVHGIMFVKGRPTEPPPNATMNGFHAVLAVGHLVMSVFLADVPEGPIVTGRSDSRQLLIWPTTSRSMRWPPAVSFADDDELEAESRRTPDGVEVPLSEL